MEKLIITAAICGAEVTKEHNPAVPYTVEEMVREAKSAYDAGAAVIHVHVRKDDGTPTQDRERFREVLDAIRAAVPEAILIPSTGGATGITPEERLQPTELAVIQVTPEGLVLREVNENSSVEEVVSKTEATLIIPETVGTF